MGSVMLPHIWSATSCSPVVPVSRPESFELFARQVVGILLALHARPDHRVVRPLRR